MTFSWVDSVCCLILNRLSSFPIFYIRFSSDLYNKNRIQRLEKEADDQRFEDLTRVLFDQATLSEGQQLADPGSYVQRLNRLLVELSE